MSGLRIIQSAESVGATASAQAKRRNPGRVSTSFSADETYWLDQVLKAIQQGNHHRIRELAGDPVVTRLAQKAQNLHRISRQNQVPGDDSKEAAQ